MILEFLPLIIINEIAILYLIIDIIEDTTRNKVRQQLLELNKQQQKEVLKQN